MSSSWNYQPFAPSGPQDSSLFLIGALCLYFGSRLFGAAPTCSFGLKKRKTKINAINFYRFVGFDLPLAVNFYFCSRGGFLPAGIYYCSPSPGSLELFSYLWLDYGVFDSSKTSLFDALPDLCRRVPLPSLDLLSYLSPVFGVCLASVGFLAFSSDVLELDKIWLFLFPVSEPIRPVLIIWSNLSWIYFYSASSSSLLAPNIFMFKLLVN